MRGNEIWLLFTLITLTALHHTSNDCKELCLRMCEWNDSCVCPQGKQKKQLHGNKLAMSVLHYAHTRIISFELCNSL